jgi:glycerophosphoryl diester phosphodiesterase
MPAQAPDLKFQTITTAHRIIAHASGGSDMGNYPNAIECLDRWHAAGVRHFEFDLQWTSDGRLIGLHDWGPTFRRWFDISALPWSWRLSLRLRPRHGIPLNLFEQMPMQGGLTPVTPERLATWLAQHPEAWLVTDIKHRNPAALKVLAECLGSYRRQVMAQVFSVEEIDLARSLGYGQVAWANYVPRLGLAKLARRLPTLPLDVVVLDESTLASPACDRPLETLRAAGFEVWVFTVNDPDRVASLPGAINGIITDQLLPVSRSG